MRLRIGALTVLALVLTGYAVADAQRQRWTACWAYSGPKEWALVTGVFRSPDSDREMIQLQERFRQTARGILRWNDDDWGSDGDCYGWRYSDRERSSQQRARQIERWQRRGYHIDHISIN